MSDPFFDAARAAGRYPPKGFDRMGRDEQKAMIETCVQRGDVNWWMHQYFHVGLSEQAQAAIRNHVLGE